mmetsp:Transcript_23674/g.42864  ORF Transcript_23674/g.42864 Transcript_23674/m.42864 type:complete len:367 (+) Transcript_23674:172-1272(+)|eukprot:CAMPEP_0197652186 /NCGR_PEP_ID=MMETSP1338-20131121/34292_1 /TAXON_ID=43686 ORGANISM="Pelagodinium beii, Strain RCC1491" /NCGR_SAMPLE_ID=MMETSP1338 /ASSEMBLY_ACC=CAM_ASM_000754 /LENGTH=366 /DNA_ID=CAMNT_0043226997 /DNA_START=158 /DNA_END=1258 /DNA_ORIENTATION=+
MGGPSPLLVAASSPSRKNSALEALDLTPSPALETKLSPILLTAFQLPAAAAEKTCLDSRSSAGSTADATFHSGNAAASEEDCGPSQVVDSSKLVLRNTFLDFERFEPLFPQRRRAYSDWSGAKSRMEAGAPDVTREELLAPMMGAVYRGSNYADEERIDLQEVKEPESSVPNSSAEWWDQRAETFAGYWVPGEAAAVYWPPAEPQPPAGKALFKPKWHYGNTWPFNCAPTTLLIGNLPWELTQLELIGTLDKLGFSGFYDFIYLPCNLKTGRHVGTAIVNLTRHSYAITLATHMNEFTDWGVADGQTASSVKWSLPRQGLLEHIEDFRNDPAMHESVDDSLRPMVFADGWRVNFPEPTKQIHGRHR